MAPSKFTSMSADELRKRAKKSDVLEAIQFEHHQIVEQSRIGTSQHSSRQDNYERNRRDDIYWGAACENMTPKEENTDYIHARYVDCFEIPKKYVAIQGLRRKTLEQFWQLVWEENSRIIVMLDELEVAEEDECALYWHPYGNKQKIFQADELLIRTVSETTESGYVETTFDVSNCTTGESRLIKHYMYLDWSELGVPATCESFMQLNLDVEDERHRLLTEMVDEPALGPIIVHCRGGGRTGVFCAVDSCVYQLVKTGTVSLPETVLKISQQQCSSVSAIDEYIFIYRILYEFAKSFEMCSFIRDILHAG
uniref:Protein tyrosine phosphatase n=1 Tax=Glyptapanteles flavicoxis TaxID=463051 RepID=B7S8E0_9HYME|nr:protein tyrosine phosphatase [Glyptapanteles flavicoxis]